MRKGIISVVFLFFSIIVTAQYSLTAPTYTQDFNTLVNSGTSSVLPTGWLLSESGSSANTTYSAGTGSGTTGDTYSFGTSASTERSLGGLQSGSLVPTIGFWVTNNTASTITGIQIIYNGEQWRIGANSRIDSLTFQYSLSADSVNDVSATWISVNSLGFRSPVTSGAPSALDGNSNRVPLSSIISGISIPNGTSFFIRWLDYDATGFEDGLGIDDFTLNVISSLPMSTDYYRSIASGDWTTLATWETSSTNADPWSPAGTPPDLNSDSIFIRNGDTVTITSTVTADEIVIESGGVLENDIAAANLFTIADGASDDMIIHSGGIYQVTSSQSYANHIAINSGAIIRIQTGGTIQINNNGGINTAYAYTPTSFVWEDSSIFNWNTTGSAGMQATFFPDVDDSTIPVFRFSANQGLSLGGGTSTIINGILETSVPISFQNSSPKIFRNGIRGSGDVTNSSVGLFIIDGVTAELGGTGIITTTGGLQIGSVSGTGTLVSVTSDKTIVGYLSLWNSGTGAYLEIGSNDLIVTVDIFGGTATSYIRTNGTGRLIQNSVGIATRTFPIGHTSYNPVYISVASGSYDFAARVDTGIAPIIAFPTYGINRTWNIQSLSGDAPNTTVTFQYGMNDTSVNVSPDEALEILMNDGIAWSIIPGNDSIVPTGTDPYLITTTSALTINSSSETPYCLGKKGGWILPLDCIVECRSQKQNNNGLISFEVNSCAEVNSFEIQRSSGGRPFTTIAEVPPDITKNRFSYTDADLQPGINLYRIKVNRLSGTIKYSNTSAIINDTKGWVITGVYPSPASDIVKLAISSAKAEQMQFRIYNTAGVLMRQWQGSITVGTSIIEADVQQLAAGIYIFTVDEKGIKKSIRFIKN